MFVGKSFAVTGATSGIGRDISIRLANEGSTVYICGRRKERLDALISEYPTMKATCLDVTDWNAVEEWINGIEEVDGLINNAAMFIPEVCHQVSKDALVDTIATNITAPLHLTQAFSKKLIEANRSGCIVNISSIAAVKANAGAIVYCCCKAAVNQMTRSAAFELGPHKIRVNAVCPTLVETELTRKHFESEDFNAFEQSLPLGQIPSTHDITDAILFLLSDKAKMITGQALYVDSGHTL